MKIDDKIRDEKLQYNINREVAKISALLSGKIDKYECPTGEEILPSNQRQIIEQAKFAIFSFRKSFWKTNKNDWRSRNKTNTANGFKFLRLNFLNITQVIWKCKMLATFSKTLFQSYLLKR